MIKQKTGQCIDCPPGVIRYLTAGRCKGHYKAYRDKVCAERKAARDPDGKQKIAAGELKTYFANQALQMPRHCEECGAVLPMSPPWLKKATNAHILAKRKTYGFPSVACHPQNMVFLCPLTCHQDFDQKGQDHIKQMKCLPILRERVAVLLPELTPQERNKVPEYYL